MGIKYMVAFLLVLILSGCWNNQDIKKSVLVVGTGIDKSRKGYELSVELLKPGSSPGQTGGSSQTATGGKSTVLTIEAPTLFEGARNFIRDTKRRLIFTHNRLWVISEAVARENIAKPLDIMLRDQMFRLRSFIFITKEKPQKILATPTLFGSLASLEIAEGIDSVRFVSDYPNIDAHDFFEMLAAPVQAGYLPIIKINKTTTQSLAQIDSTAVIKKKKLVGTLTMKESMGVLWLNKRIKKGAITTNLGSPNQKASLEIQTVHSDIKPMLQDKQLDVKITIKIKGTVAHIPTNMKVTKQTMHQMERNIANTVKGQIQASLAKLQKKYKTDIVDFGGKTYRAYPKEWHQVAKDWDTIFSNATTHLNVNVAITHQGLLNEIPEGPIQKPQYNPFSTNQSSIKKDEKNDH